MEVKNNGECFEVEDGVWVFEKEDFWRDKKEST